MSKKGTKALASATLMSLVLTTALAAGPVKAAQGSVTRIGAADRYATAAQVATQNWTSGAKDVVLVSGEGYADAVSASVLAKQLDAPILLTTAGSLNADAKAALETLKPTNVYVVGGNASVSASIRSELAANYKLVELGGANRYETNVAVAKKLVELGVKADNVLLVGGEGFSDALSVAPVAATKGQILLLGNNNEDSMKSVIDFVKDNNSKVTVVGTSNVISDAIYSAVGAVDRVNGGASRFDTNINVLNKFADNLKADKLYVANASGNGYADALVASALAGKSAAPLVLVDTDGTTATENAIAYIKAKATKTTDLNVVGGTGVVSDAVVAEINNAVNPTTTTGEATVNSITALNLNQFKVEFNEEVDEDTAEDLSNYKVDGIALNSTTDQAVAVLQSDNKSVIVTLQDPETQYDDLDVTVKKGILTADKSATIPEFTQTISFSDTTVPTLKSVTAQGNNKITVEFSEAVDMQSISALKSYFKINGQSISSFGLDYDASLSKIKDTFTTSGSIKWASKVQFYFDSPLPTGTNTLKVSDGVKDGILRDAAGFTFKESSMDFAVDTLTTSPEVKSITAEDDGIVYVNFDRAMDTKTALVKGNYKINTTQLSGTYVDKMELKNNDTQVKITLTDAGSNLLNTNSNTLYIDDSVKDAYGNKVASDTTKSFELTADDTKPTVTSVTVVDSQTIRVRFSKDVDSDYATNTANYKLKDSDGTDISSHISGINKISSDVYDVKLARYTTSGADARLSSGDYTLTIKNIIDKASTPNTMDDYTATISGSDSVAPTVTDIVNVASDENKVVVYFSEAMDSSSITDASNYKFVNGEGDTKTLPSGATLTAGSDDKSVTIKFPTSYKVKTGYTGNSGSSNYVDKIVVANVKDEAGNVLDSIAYSSSIASYTTADQATVEADTFKMYYDGDTLKADIKFSKSIDNLDPTDFRLNGVQPSSGYVNGGKVTLTFNTDTAATSSNSTATSLTYDFNAAATKLGFTALGSSSVFAGQYNSTPDIIDVVKANGSASTLTISANGKSAIGTTDESGRAIAATTTPVTVYDYEVAPKSTPDYWTVLSPAKTGTTDAAVLLTFDTPLDKNSGISVDDFIFTSDNGTNLDASDVYVQGNTVIFRFDLTTNSSYADYFKATKTIKIRAKSTVALRSQKDDDGNYATYTPSSNDLKNRSYTVDQVTPSDQDE